MSILITHQGVRRMEDSVVSRSITIGDRAMDVDVVAADLARVDPHMLADLLEAVGLRATMRGEASLGSGLRAIARDHRTFGIRRPVGRVS